MTKTLKPCPFCGAELVANDHPRRRRDDHEITIYTHPQGNCHLAGYQLDYEERELWNRRAAERDAARLRQELEECQQNR
jgi:hypothetical protein